MKPEFEVTENAIKMVLPLLKHYVNLHEDEIIIYKLVSKTMLKPISDIAVVEYEAIKVHYKIRLEKIFNKMNLELSAKW